MKNLFTLLLIGLFAAPASSNWLPHDTVHALHEYYNAHYEGLTHTHEKHSHSDQDSDEIHHPVQLGSILDSADFTLFSTADAGQKKNSSKPAGLLASHILAYQLTPLLLEKDSGNPPVSSISFRYRNDIYLTTQRFRV